MLPHAVWSQSPFLIPFFSDQSVIYQVKAISRVKKSFFFADKTKTKKQPKSSRSALHPKSISGSYRSCCISGPTGTVVRILWYGYNDFKSDDGVSTVAASPHGERAREHGSTTVATSNRSPLTRTPKVFQRRKQSTSPCGAARSRGVIWCSRLLLTRAADPATMGVAMDVPAYSHSLQV